MEDTIKILGGTQERFTAPVKNPCPVQLQHPHCSHTSPQTLSRNEYSPFPFPHPSPSDVVSGLLDQAQAQNYNM